MKKRLLLPALLLFAVTFVSTAQEALNKGQMVVDLYYGTPNLITGYLQAANTASGSSNVSVGGIGPLGGRFGYMVGDKVSIGLDANYANSSVSWTGPGSNGNTYTYTVSLPRYRVMAAFDFHLIKNENFDFYYMVHIGFGNWTLQGTTNDPAYSFTSIKFASPLAFRTGVGVRYFFTKNIGLNADFGFLGGGLLQGGVSFKFP